ncbi:protein TsetseEP [Drosophila obscura]|uniref:protein TsetseEP n=1 Tax=Drosophila obscura TaxID=7282 RepID=UPI001BB19274|nr:protein TsetseEP [Drosophila obscura]
MFLLALFCLALAAMGGQAKPYEPTAQHIVIVTPQVQAQMRLEPTLRYVHGLSPLARVATPHHEETYVYVPASAAASLGSVLETVGSGRAGGLEGKQFEGVQETSNQIQQQVSQGVEIVSGQIGEAAAAAAAAGAGFFPALFPGGSKKDDLIETPANTQPLIAAEARHFYSLPQVYHTHPVVDVVHTPVYSWPISSIRARSIQPEPEAAAEPAVKLAPTAEPGLKAEPEIKAEPELKKQAEPKKELDLKKELDPKKELELKKELDPKKELELKKELDPKKELELAKAVTELKEEPEFKKELAQPELPLLKEQQPLEQPQPQPIIAEQPQPQSQGTKAEFAGRLLESNAIKQELKSPEIAKEQVKEEPAKGVLEELLVKGTSFEKIDQILKSEPAESIAIATPIVPQA